MTKFFSKFKNPCFSPIFPISGAKIFFPENPALSIQFLALCQTLEKSNDTIPRKQKNGMRDRPTS